MIRILGISGRIHSGKDTLGRALVDQLNFTKIAFADGIREFLAKQFDWPLEWVACDEFKGAVSVLARRGDPRRDDDDYATVGIGTGYTGIYTGRDLLQRTGTEAARSVFGPDVWVDVAMAKCGVPDGIVSGDLFIHRSGVRTSLKAAGRLGEALGGDQRHYVITDVRHPNELRRLHIADAEIIRLNRADRREVHVFLPGEVSERCGHGALFPGDEGACGLPPEAHPSHFSGQTHSSETALPDESNDWIQYDAVFTGSLEENTAAALAWIKKGLEL